ncbi:MAG: hypothetical protein ACLFNQ_06980 [Spirochaetaceae bacterium]
MILTGTLRQWAGVLSLICALAVNALASTGVLNGITTGEISDQFDVYLVPAGYVFSIWGIIYIGLIVFTVYQARSVHRDDADLDRLGSWFVLSNLVNALWIVLFHFELFLLTLPVIAFLLYCLIRIILILEPGHTLGPAPRLWIAHLTFGIYLGWVTVATVANAVQTLSAAGYSGAPLTAEIWALILYAAVVLISWGFSFRSANLPHALVLVWALAGTAVADSGNTLIATAAWSSVALVVAGYLAGYAKRSRYGSPVVV